MHKAQKFRHLLTEQKTIIAPGVFDGLSARLVEQAGFQAIYASGGAIARSAGLPDLGLLSSTEVLQVLQQISETTKLPLVADADTGFGNSLNVKRTMQHFAQLDIAALHLEDQQFPKRCGHLSDKSLVSETEMVHKVSVARQTLPQATVLIARTDAIAVEGFAAALKRARAYIAAGADMIFIEAPQTLEQIEIIAHEIPSPKLINMFYGGKTPLVPVAQLEKMGYQLVIIPSDLQRAAIHAMQQTLNAIRQHGDSHSLADKLTSFQEREQIIGTADYLK